MTVIEVQFVQHFFFVKISLYYNKYFIKYACLASEKFPQYCNINVDFCIITNDFSRFQSHFNEF